VICGSPEPEQHLDEGACNELGVRLGDCEVSASVWHSRALTICSPAPISIVAPLSGGVCDAEEEEEEEEDGGAEEAHQCNAHFSMKWCGRAVLRARQQVAGARSSSSRAARAP